MNQDEKPESPKPGTVVQSPKGTDAKPESKDDRRAAALRANLRRRKAQARGRKADSASGEGSAS